MLSTLSPKRQTLNQTIDLYELFGLGLIVWDFGISATSNRNNNSRIEGSPCFGPTLELLSLKICVYIYIYTYFNVTWGTSKNNSFFVYDPGGDYSKMFLDLCDLSQTQTRAPNSLTGG